VVGRVAGERGGGVHRNKTADFLLLYIIIVEKTGDIYNSEEAMGREGRLYRHLTSSRFAAT